ncbi:MAG: PEP-CTERM sorting domain-containing protein [Planctomycetota bacterium]|nr:PEP-CTERM sorting domain-containing protein [Planctomycetota bacterium]
MTDHIVSLRVGFFVGMVFALAATTAGAPLGLGTTPLFPDIAALTSVQTNYAYDAATGQFRVTGGISQYSPNSTTSYVAGGGTGLSIIANVNSGGGLFGSPGGTLVINGVIPQIGIYAPVDLLRADLTAFGFSGATSSTVFEFTGNVTGGVLQAAFSPEVGIIINPGITSFNGSFLGDFTGSGGTVDTFRIPEPATMSLLALAGPALLRRRRN